jgi:3-dehydroquinate dehydratase / shikimate dehydrogenase
MIVVAITGPRMSEALSQLRTSRPFADMFEFRLDLLAEIETGSLFRATRRPVIATCRPVREGGRFRGSESRRMSRLLDAVRAGAVYVDIELDAHEAFSQMLRKAGLRPRLIVSKHFFGAQRPRVRRDYARLRSTGADVIKLAYETSDAWQLSSAIEFLARARADRQKAIAVAMGEAGEASRVLYRRFGGWATYAGTEDGKGSAPGQLPASVMKKVYSAHLRTRRTKVFGLVGFPVAHSKGMYIHNPVYHVQRVDAVYVRFPVSNLRLFMRTVGPVLSGCSVTIPHKRAMMKFLSSAQPSVGAIGAVNTIVRRRRGWLGANTDAGAALDSIEERGSVAGRSMLILGTGGSARAIAVEARRRGASVTVTGRKPHRVASLARATGAAGILWNRISTGRWNILVNTTPVGMWPRSDEMPIRSVPPGTDVVFDVIYNPSMTKLLRTAESAGASIVSGVQMFIKQAAGQIALFTGTRPEESLLRRLFTRAI